MAILFLVLPWQRLRTFFIGYGSPEACVSSLRGYRSVLSAVFRFHLPSLSSDLVIRDLLRSFRLSSVERVMRPPAWDLSRVLAYLVSPAFEPLSQASLRSLTLKTLFVPTEYLPAE